MNRLALPCLVVLSLSVLTFLPSQGMAHGVRGTTSGGAEALCASFAYDDGGPMGYAEVEVLAPEAEQPFQTGRTDRNGYFCFRPDTVGRWKLSAKDADGHFIRVGTKVSKEMLEQ